MTEQGTTEWYAAVAAAMARRERALTMINRWQGKLTEAEGEVNTLTGNTQTNTPEQNTEQEQIDAVQ